jgi:hypothetical protein
MDAICVMLPRIDLREIVIYTVDGIFILNRRSTFLCCTTCCSLLSFAQVDPLYLVVVSCSLIFDQFKFIDVPLITLFHLQQLRIKNVHQAEAPFAGIH